MENNYVTGYDGRRTSRYAHLLGQQGGTVTPPQAQTTTVQPQAATPSSVAVIQPATTGQIGDGFTRTVQAPAENPVTTAPVPAKVAPKVVLSQEEAAMAEAKAKALVEKGDNFYSSGQYNEAIKEYDEAIRIKPDYDYALFSRAESYSRKGEYAQAIEDFNKAIKVNPNYAPSFYGRGIAYANKGEWDKALADYSKSIELDPSNPNCFASRGVAYENKKEFAQAIADYKQALSIDPKNEFAKSHLAELNMKMAAEAKKDDVDKWFDEKNFSVKINGQDVIINNSSLDTLTYSVNESTDFRPFTKAKNVPFTSSEVKNLIGCCMKLEKAIKENKSKDEVEKALNEYKDAFKNTGTFKSCISVDLANRDTAIQSKLESSLTPDEKYLNAEDKVGEYCYLFYNNFYGQYADGKMENFANKWQNDNNSDLISDYFPTVQNRAGHIKAKQLELNEGFQKSSEGLYSALQSGVDYTTSLNNAVNSGNKMLGYSYSGYNNAHNPTITTLAIDKNPGALRQTMVKYSGYDPLKAIDKGPLTGDCEAQFYEGLTFGLYGKKGRTQTDAKRKFDPNYKKESNWFSRGCSRAGGAFISVGVPAGAVCAKTGIWFGPTGWLAAGIGAGVIGGSAALINFVIGALDDE